tara:strand:+ start:758 stop:2629 length:1872 start_codon:yes stop_codon:yes gene_type:complete
MHKTKIDVNPDFGNWINEHTKTRLQFFIGLLLVIACQFVGASPATTVTDIAMVDTRFNLIPTLHYIAAKPEQTLADIQSLDDESWQVSRQEHRNFGHNQRVIWFRTQLKKSYPLDAPIFLRVDYPHHDYIDLYLQQGDQTLAHFEAGDERSFSSRPIEHRTFLAPVEIPTGEVVDVYLRIQTSGLMMVPIELITQVEAVKDESVLLLFVGLYFGVIIIMLIYNTFIYTSLRDSTYLYYLMYVAAVAAQQFTLFGFGFQYLWLEPAVVSNNFMIMFTSGLMETSAVLFVIKFIRLRRMRSQFDRTAGYSLLAGSLAMLCASFFMNFATFITVVNILGLVGVGCGLYIGVKGWLMGFKAARLFATAWFIYLMFIGWYLLDSMGVIDSTTYGTYAIAIGSAIELSLLSFAFADRMNQEKELRLHTQNTLINVQRAMNEDLDSKVKQRTRALEEANRKLEYLSTTDGLTGLFNRRHFDEEYERLYKESINNKQPLAVLMIDVDHFKRLNDEYGHAFGDRCLIRAGELIRQVLSSPYDICARYGGEEFIIALPRVNHSHARQVAESLRYAFSNTIVSDGRVAASMTISVGLAFAMPTDINQREVLLKNADNYLYQAKNNGRNQVAIAS